MPEVNATLNLVAGLLLVLGFISIKQRKEVLHKRLMLSSFAVSVLFLVSYLVYHTCLRVYTGSHGRAFAGVGWVRGVYFSLLISHVLLAVVVPVLALVTIARGLRGDWVRHRRIARITFPIWLYVSVTGVVIYLMLYRM